MSSVTTTTISSSLEKIAEKAGKTLAEIQEAYDVALTSIPPSIKGDKRRTRVALQIVNRDLAINTRSDAVTYEGIIVGAKRVRDLMERIREDALNQYNTDPEKAIADGLVKLSDDGENVIVLDNRAETNGKVNKNLGKPRPEHMYMRECVIAARKPGEKDFVVGKMTLWNQQAKLTIPILKLVSFAANGGIEDGQLALRSSVTTTFVVKQELPQEEIMGIIDDSFEGHYKELDELFDYHSKIKGTPEQWTSFVVTDGTAQWVNKSEEGKNHSITLTGSSLPKDHPGIKVWVPAELGNLIDFGNKSIITVIGYTTFGKGWDKELKQQTDEDVVQINAYSVIARPGFGTEGIDQGEII